MKRLILIIMFQKVNKNQVIQPGQSKAIPWAVDYGLE